MKVLWFACTPSCYDIKVLGGWIEALEKIFCRYLPNIELAIAFEHSDDVFKVKKNNVTYYPINIKRNRFEKIKNKFIYSPIKEYNKIRPRYIKVIEDFKPDLIQCFGTELWHYSLLQKDFKIPFVVHMMGFWTIINMSSEILNCHRSNTLNPYRYFQQIKMKKTSDEHMKMEIESMKSCRYFMGRTEWDKNICKYFSPNSTYFYCPEAIREEILLSENKWRFKSDETIKLITISGAGNLKGNEMMLRTAWILKNRFNKKVEWIYTTSQKSMKKYEILTGIKCSEVGIRPIGRLTSAQLADVMCESQMFIHSSIIDNSPNAICEAQLIGIPIIATNIGGIPQIIEDGVTGFLYPYNEPYALAFKIMDLHNNKEVLTKISNNETLISKNRHNPQLLANKIANIYNDILLDYKNTNN